MSRYLSVDPDPFPARDTLRLSVRVAARTDRGLDRANNEDRAAFADLAAPIAFEPPAALVLTPRDGAFVGLVCDGMGGQAGGEVASRLAVQTIIGFLQEVWGRAPREAASPQALIASIEAAAERIRAEARREPRLARMGTTTTLATITDNTLVCAQVGDSRAYLFRRGALTQVTQDQTFAELLRRSSRLALDGVEIQDGPQGQAVAFGSNIILQAVGASSRLEVVITRTPLEDGDTVLLCSDGLAGVVPDAAIASALAARGDPDAACADLVARALAEGGPDNITCVVFRLGVVPQETT